MSDHSLRILHIASGDLWAGAEVMLYRLAVAQQELPETDVAVVLFNEGRLAAELRAAGIPTSVYPESTSSLFNLVKGCREEILRHRADIVHTHRIKEDVIGSLASLGLPLQRVRTVHGTDEVAGAAMSLGNRVARVIQTMCVRHCFQMSFAVSAPLAQSLARVFRSDRVSHVANGINAYPFEPMPAKAAWPVRIGLVGRLVPVKRVDLFIAMAALLQEHAPGSFQFDIYGDGPQEESLKEQAGKLGLTGCLTFHGFTPDVERRMRDLHLLYLTSDSEGLPMVLLEAMTLDLPVVAHAVGEIPTVLAHGQCGTLITDHSPRGYAAEALRYLENRNDFEAKAAAAGKRVRDAYSAEASARAYRAKYAEIRAGSGMLRDRSRKP